MAGCPIPVNESQAEITEAEFAAQKEKALAEIAEAEKLNEKKGKTMKEDKQSKHGISQHKRMAMGEKIELKCGGMAKGGKAEKKVAKKKK